MRAKTKNAEINIPTWLVLFALLVIDNVYANHCKKASVKKLIENSEK